MHGMVINVLRKRVLVKEIFHVVVMVAVQLIHLNAKYFRKIANIFLSISFNICFRCSKEPSH